MDLVTVLAARCDQARLAMAEHPGWSLVPSLLGLLSCAVPTQIKAKLLQLLAAIARTPDIVHPLWQALEGAGLLAGSRAGLVAELEEVEARQEEFPLTRAFLQLLDTLTKVEIPGALGASSLALNFLTFVQDKVLSKFHARTGNLAKLSEVRLAAVSIIKTQRGSRSEAAGQCARGGGHGHDQTRAASICPHPLSLTHFLLGLRIRILQSTAHPPPLCMASCRHLVSASYRLVFTLISKPDLRSSSSYIAAQVATNTPTAPLNIGCGPTVVEGIFPSWK